MEAGRPAARLLVGEAITATQAIGGAVVLVGLALAGRSSEHRTAQSTWPDIAPVDNLAPPATSRKVNPSAAESPPVRSGSQR